MVISAENVEFNTPELSSCPSESVEITLTWPGAENDLNLIVIEPTPSKVSKKNMIGDKVIFSGDVIRGSSNGETYLTTCHSDENSILGDYVINVNYFKG